MSPGVFVTGTGTGVGKTIVSACLVRRWDAAYWKPVQTGLAEEDGDTPSVTALAGTRRVLAPQFAYHAPLSPEAAAAAEGADAPALDAFTLPVAERPLVVEGAGGVLVPLNGGATMADLMARLGLPVILVAATALGTINHTLLSLEALRRRAIAVAGVVLCGVPDAGNREAIARHGQVRILHELPWLERMTQESVAMAAAAFPAFADIAGA